MNNQILDEQKSKSKSDSVFKYQATIFNVISSALFLLGSILLLFEHDRGRIFTREDVFIIYIILYSILMCVDLFIQHYFGNRRFDKNVAELAIISIVYLGF